ncbi:RidA family protein [Brevibacterium album]|uniref:RidA family protein n=1 Tax=Brevibacterium album TaxID=417948 RepID=UPI0004070E46|nr:RidA family protein [Brevibacterium album]
MGRDESTARGAGPKVAGLERAGSGEVAGARMAEAVATDDLIFFSGITAQDTSLSAAEQTSWCLRKLDGLLERFGEDQGSVLMIHVWLADMRYFGAMNKAWNHWIDTANPPARTCVSGALHRPDVLVEVVAIAARRAGEGES